MAKALSRTRILTNYPTTVIRKLDNQGKVNINVGDWVAPDVVVGTSNISAGFRVIRLSGLLSIDPEQAANYLKKKIGERVYSGEVVASKKGLFKETRVQAPVDGILEQYDQQTGDLVVRFLPSNTAVPAGVWGKVISADTSAVTIATRVSVIFGVLGVGFERSGVLHSVVRGGDFLLHSHIDNHSKGQIVVGGGLVSKEAVAKACAVGVSGIIAGGIHARDFKSFGGMIGVESTTDIGTSLVIMEGLGLVPFGDEVMSLLVKLSNHYGFISGQHRRLVIPEQVGKEDGFSNALQNPPLEELIAKNPAETELKVGDLVRIICGSQLGKQGKVVAVNTDSLPSGLVNMSAVEVDLIKEKVRLPVQNVEIVTNR